MRVHEDFEPARNAAMASAVVFKTAFEWALMLCSAKDHYGSGVSNLIKLKMPYEYIKFLLALVKLCAIMAPKLVA
jgi:hypothetical protein